MPLIISSGIRVFRIPTSLLSNFPVNLTFCRHSSTESERLYTSLIAKSIHRIHLTQIHAQLYVHGLHNNGFIITKLINVCSNFGEIRYARNLFDEFPDQYVFLWNAIIRCYSMHNMFDEVFELYSTMQQGLIRPDRFTFPHVVKACGGLRAVRYGRAVHAQIFRNGFADDVFLQNGLLSFYVKCEEYSRARVVFDCLSVKDVVSWTSIVSGYAQSGQPIEALRFFKQMRGSDLNPDSIALVSVLKAYSDTEELDQGRCVHGLVVKSGHEFEPDLRVALISLYSKCRQVMAAKSLFDEMKIFDVILWNAMISGFAKNGHPNEALSLFNEMISRNIPLDAVTMQSSVLATALLGSLEQARWMGDYVYSSRFKDSIVVRTALIDMYAKCGSVELAREVFNRTLVKDVLVWSAMITGYGLHGRGSNAIVLFNEMKDSDVHPNDVTFLGLITACSRAGLVGEGWEFFHSMKSYGIKPDQKHYAGVVDLLGRAGYLDKAYEFIVSMPVEPGVSAWGALLSACQIHRHVTLAEYAAGKLFIMDPMNIGYYVQLSNLYASLRMWSGVANIRQLMKSKGLNKDFGYTKSSSGWRQGAVDTEHSLFRSLDNEQRQERN